MVCLYLSANTLWRGRIILSDCCDFDSAEQGQASWYKWIFSIFLYAKDNRVTLVICGSCLSQWNTAYSRPLQQRTQSCLSPQHPEGGFLSRRCLSAFSSCSQVPAAEAKSWVNEGERQELLFLHNHIGQRVYCGCGVLRILGFWSDHPCPISWRGDFMPVILGCGLLTLHQVISL